MAALVLVTLVAPPAARAGTYEHRSVSPPSPGLDGWTPAVVAPAGHVSTGVDGAGLWAGFFDREWFAPGDLAEWAYSAPAGTTIAAWAFERRVAGIGAGDWNTRFSAGTDGRWRLVAVDVPSVDRPWGRIAVSGLGASALQARLVCGGPRACRRAAPGTTLHMRDVRVLLHDAHAPAVSAVQGDLARKPVLSGVERVSFAAADRGGGVHRALVVVDGRVHAAVVVDGNGGRCRDLVPGGLFEASVRVPCRESASATVALDTRRLTDGRHTITVLVDDAAGNVTTAYGPVTKTVANRPRRPRPPIPRPPTPRPPAPRPPATEPPGAAPPPPATAPSPRRAVVHAWLERRNHRARALTARHGVRVRIRGRITDPEGRPLAGAALTIAERMIDGHGRPLAGRGPTAVASTDLDRRLTAWHALRRDGRFTAFTRIGPSRQIRVSAEGAPPRRLVLRVRAPLSLRATRTSTTARVRGRLRGGPRVPRRGALIELQTRAGARWSTRLVVRTRRGGRFAGRLRGLPPGDIAIRARMPRQPGIPYAAGTARAVSPPRTGGRTAPRTSR